MAGQVRRQQGPVSRVWRSQERAGSAARTARLHKDAAPAAVMRVPGSEEAAPLLARPKGWAEEQSRWLRRSSADRDGPGQARGSECRGRIPAGLPHPSRPLPPSWARGSYPGAAPTPPHPSHSPQATRGSWREPSSVWRARRPPSVVPAGPWRPAKPRPSLPPRSPPSALPGRRVPTHSGAAAAATEAGARADALCPRAWPGRQQVPPPLGLPGPFRVPAWGRAPVLPRPGLAGDWRCHGNCRRAELFSQVTQGRDRFRPEPKPSGSWDCNPRPLAGAAQPTGASLPGSSLFWVIVVAKELKSGLEMATVNHPVTFVRLRWPAWGLRNTGSHWCPVLCLQINFLPTC